MCQKHYVCVLVWVHSFDWAAYLGFLNSFFFWMWLFVSKSPWSFLSYSLWILSCYKTNKSMEDSGSALTVRWTPPCFDSASSTLCIWQDTLNKYTQPIHDQLQQGPAWIELLYIKALIPLGNMWQPRSTGPQGAGRCSLRRWMRANMEQDGGRECC